MHRRCAGLSESHFKSYVNSDIPFYCPYCQLANQADKIKSLKATIQSLQERITILNNKASIAVNPTCVQPTNVASETSGHIKESQPVPSTSDRHSTLLHHAGKPTQLIIL